MRIIKDQKMVYYESCKLYWRSYYLWKTDYVNIREYHLKLAMRDRQIAHAIMTVERKKVNHVE